MTHLSLTLRSAGSDVMLVVHPKFGIDTGNRRCLAAAGVEFLDLPILPQNRFLRVVVQRFYMLWKLRGQKFDSIVGHGWGGSHVCLRVHLRAGGKFVWHDHLEGSFASAPEVSSFKLPSYYPYPFSVRRVIQAADAVIIGSQRGKYHLNRLHRFCPNVYVLPPLQALEPSLVQDRPLRNPCRFTVIGRLTNQKGILQILSLWKQLDLPDVELHLYGDDPNGRYQAEAQKLDIRCVHFHGRYSHIQLPAIMEATDVGLVCSLSEGYPLTSLEFMAYGVPFIMTAVGAAEEMAEDNPDMIVAEISDVSLAEAIKLMIDRGRSGQLSRRRLQEHYYKRFSYESTAAAYSDLLLGPGKYPSTETLEPRSMQWC